MSSVRLTEAITNHQLATVFDRMINTSFAFGDEMNRTYLGDNALDVWDAVAHDGNAARAVLPMRSSIIRLAMLLRASNKPLACAGREGALNPSSAEALVYSITAGFGWYAASDVTIALSESERLSVWSLLGITPLALITVPVSARMLDQEDDRGRLFDPPMVRGRAASYSFTRDSVDASGMPYIAVSAFNSIGLNPLPCLDASETGAGFKSEPYVSSDSYKQHKRLTAANHQSVTFPKATIAVRWDASTERVLSWTVATIDLSTMADSLLPSSVNAPDLYEDDVYDKPVPFQFISPENDVIWKPTTAWYESLFGGIPKYNLGYKDKPVVNTEQYADVYEVIANQVPSIHSVKPEAFSENFSTDLFDRLMLSVTGFPVKSDSLVRNVTDGDLRWASKSSPLSDEDYDMGLTTLRLCGLTRADEFRLDKGRCEAMALGIVEMYRDTIFQGASLADETSVDFTEAPGVATRLLGVGVLARYLDVLQAKFDWLSENLQSYLDEDDPYPS